MRWTLACCMVLLAYAQPQPSAETALLGRIRAKAAENLKHLPDYTCTETIERSYGRQYAKKFEVLDRVRLEVAYVGGRELFGWPGASKINEPEINKLVAGGTVGNGDFALVPRDIFLSPSTTFQYVGDTDLEGKRVLSYDYIVRPPLGGYRILTASGEAIVGYHGSVLVDPGTLDVKRLELSADDIPRELRLASATDTMDYSRVSIGTSTSLLPAGSELIMIAADGNTNRNRTIFRTCHQFTGESIIKFDEPIFEPAAVSTKPAMASVALPDDFTADLNLETPIDSDSAAVGDSIRATLQNSIKSSRTIVVPKGAVLTGHISILQRRGNLYLWDLAFASLDSANGHAA